jgi:hypothetical protein
MVAMFHRQARWAVGLHRVFLCAASIWLVYGYVRLVSSATQNREFYVAYLQNQSTLKDPIPPAPAHHPNTTATPVNLDDLAEQVVADDNMQRYRHEFAAVRVARAQAETELAQFRASFGYRFPILAPAVPPYLARLFRSVLLPFVAAYAVFGLLVVATRWILRGFAPRRIEE